MFAFVDVKPALLPNPNTKSSCIIAYSPTTQAIHLHVLPFLRYTHRYKSSLWVSEFKQKKSKLKKGLAIKYSSYLPEINITEKQLEFYYNVLSCFFIIVY